MYNSAHFPRNTIQELIAIVKLQYDVTVCFVGATKLFDYENYRMSYLLLSFFLLHSIQLLTKKLLIKEIIIAA